MFTPSYFPARYIPARYFPKSGAVPAAVSTPKASYILEYRTDKQTAFWTINEAFFWSTDAAVFWSSLGEWIPWIGSLPRLIRQQYEFRLTVKAGVHGSVTGLTVNIDMPDITEDVLNVAIGSIGTRLSLAKTYQAIKVVKATLLEDGGTATHIKVVDKDSAGPLVKAYDKDDLLTTAHADVTVQGY